MVEHGGSFFLFYSGNSYANASYALGVASASSPMGPFTEEGAPIVSTGGSWVGPGHCSVVTTPAGDTYVVYHAWKWGCVNQPVRPRDLTDAVEWQGAWPAVPLRRHPAIGPPLSLRGATAAPRGAIFHPAENIAPEGFGQAGW